MPAQDEVAFLQVAIKFNAITKGRANECLKIQKTLEGQGKSVDIYTILATKKYMSPETIQKIRDALAEEEKLKTGQVRRIGNFELIEKLGSGAMGTVYKAKQVTMKRMVALKILPPKLAKAKGFVDRFMREGQTAGMLDHPNIVRAVDVGQADGYYFFAMEFVEGQTLRKVMKEQNGPMPEKAAAEIILQIARALQHAYERKIVHRDIKPDNIMITKEGVAKLMDLGLAKSTTGETDLTIAGTTFGTPDYISPEQAKGQTQVDTRADIYSLGATFYHMVTNTTPFDGESPAVVMTKHINDPLESPKKRNDKLSDEVCNIIEKMMAKDPKDRYQTPQELIEDLFAFTHGKDPSRANADIAMLRAKKKKMGKKVSTVPLIIAACVAVIGIGIAIYFATRPKKVETKTIIKETTAAQDAAAAAARLKEQRARELKAALDKLTIEEERDPTQYATLIKNYDDLAAKAKEEKVDEVSVQCETRAAAVKKRREEAAEQEVKKRRDTINELVKEEKFPAAVEQINTFPEVFRDTEARKALESLRDTIKAKAQEATDRAIAESKNLLAKKEYENARKALTPIAGYGYEDLTALAKAQEAEIDMAIKKKDDMAVEAVKESVPAIKSAIENAIKTRDWKAAFDKMDEVTKDKKYEIVMDQINPIIRRARYVQAFWQSVANGMSESVGKKNGRVAIETLVPCTIERVEGMTVYLVDAAGKKFDKIVYKTDVKNAMPFFEALANKDPDAIAGAGMVCYYGSKSEAAPEDAQKLAELAEKNLSAAVEKERDVKDLLDALLAEKTAKIEAAAAESLAKIKKLMEAGKLSDAKNAHTEFLNKFPDTKVAKDNKEYLEEVIATIDGKAVLKEMGGLSSLVHGKMTGGGKKTVSVAYDFETKDQLQDWIGDWPYSIENKRLQVGSKTVLWTDAIYGDDFDFRCTGMTPNSARLAISACAKGGAGSGEADGYYICMDSKEGLIIKKDGEPQKLKTKPTGKLVTNKPYKFRVYRDGKKLYVQVNDVTVYTDNDAITDPELGRFGLWGGVDRDKASNSSCYYTEVVISKATVSQRWVNDKLRKLSEQKEVDISVAKGKQEPGWLGLYYSGTNFDKLVAVRVDSKIVFNWQLASPIPNKVPNDLFSVRWLGQVNVPKSGKWTFYIHTDDGARLVIDGKEVYSNWMTHAGYVEKGDTCEVNLSKGFHIFKFEFFDNQLHAIAQLEWSPPGSRDKGSIGGKAVTHSKKLEDEMAEKVGGVTE